jgi:hypothetical protein
VTILAPDTPNTHIQNHGVIENLPANIGVLREIDLAAVASDGMMTTK